MALVVAVAALLSRVCWGVAGRTQGHPARLSTGQADDGGPISLRTAVAVVF